MVWLFNFWVTMGRLGHTTGYSLQLSSVTYLSPSRAIGCSKQSACVGRVVNETVMVCFCLAANGLCRLMAEKAHLDDMWAWFLLVGPIREKHNFK